MTDKQVYKTLSSILKEIDEEKYTESYFEIEQIISREGADGIYDPFEIAVALHYADKSLPMPKCITDFIVEAYKEEIESGNPVAMNQMGVLYYEKRSGIQDYAKAVEYYTMAAENGYSIAAENLGYCYYYGRSVPIDYEKAFHYYLKGALTGSPISLYKIADMYRNGYYVKKDEREAFEIYSRCFEQLEDDWGDDVKGSVCMRMGDAYFYGTGTEKNLMHALRYYHFAECAFYEAIKSGSEYYRKNLESVIERQAQIRFELINSLPTL